MLERLASHVMVTPEDVRPSRPDLTVIGTFNPGAVRLDGTTYLLIRVVGHGTVTKSLYYRSGLSFVVVMIEVGGLGEFAAGNKAKVVRKEGGREVTINVRLKDLLNRGDMDENIAMKPGDVLIIPESIF